MLYYINDAKEAPGAIGPYSQAVRMGELLFLSGQIPLDPKSGNMVAGGIAEQTEQVMKNLSGVLKHQGCDFSNVVKTTIYLTDLSHFQRVNEIYGKWLGEARPARATVQVAALPRGALVEIEALAAL